MGSLKELITGDPLHNRCMDMKTYALDEKTVLVEGWLREDRFCAVYDLMGAQVAEGPVHHMVIRLVVGGTPLSILDAEAEMVHVPLDFCHETLETIEKVIGLEISTGFTKKVRAIMGGPKGCAHLTHLLTVMSQAAFQGFVTHQRSRPHPIARSFEEIDGLDYLLGSCRAWREDGPKVVNLKAAIEKSRHDINDPER